MAPTANRRDFTSPFPKPHTTDDQPYEEGALLNTLGLVSVALTKLQVDGLIGHWEITIPKGNDWNFVTIAMYGGRWTMDNERWTMDDDLTNVRRERNQPVSGSAVVPIRCLANMSYAFDSLFIDLTVTNHELYNPTQLLINLSQFGQ